MKNAVIILSAIIFLIPLQLSYAGYDSFTVNVPNSQGGYTALIITKSDDGYTGPQGEHYTEFPSVVQLQTIYGLNASNTAPTIVTNTTYVQQPQVQSVVVPTQIIYQAPPEARDEDEEIDDYPVDRVNITEVQAPGPRDPIIEDNEWVIFTPHKKKKSNPPAAAPAAATPHSNAAKPATPAAATPGQKDHTGDHTGNHTGDHTGQAPAGDKTNPQNKQGTSS